MSIESAPVGRRPSPSLIVGLILTGLLVLVAVFAPTFLTGSAETLTSDTRIGPSAQHLLGTDEFGRDILARVLVATRLTLVMATAATALSAVFGIAIGGIAWLLPPRARNAILRMIDSAVAFPSLILALVIAAILGPGTISAMVAIGIAGIPGFARITANLAAGITHQDYILTARLLGVPAGRLLTRHVLANISGPLLVTMASSFALSLLEISSLSFVGLGVQSPEYDYGSMLSAGLASIYQQPMLVVAPSVMLIVAGLTGVLLGEGLAALFDPYARTTTKVLRKARSLTMTTAAPDDADALLEVRDLRVHTASGKELVHGISFTITSGEILGVVGESGSGKSLTAMTVAGLLPDGLSAQADVIRLGDLDLRGRVAAARLAQDIGVVFQDPGMTFNPALTMGQQLTESGRVHFGLSAADARDRAVDALDAVKVTEPERRMSQAPFELSGGMLQRASIASAAMFVPKLLIADEPTTALDVTVQAQVLRQLRQINRETGTAIIFISHDIGVVEALCDRVIVMKDGEIVDRLTASQLQAREITHPYTQLLLDASPEKMLAETAEASAPAAQETHA